MGGELLYLLPDLLADVLSLAGQFKQRVEIGYSRGDARLVG
jgi:hypothetical protein